MAMGQGILNNNSLVTGAKAEGIPLSLFWGNVVTTFFFTCKWLYYIAIFVYNMYLLYAPEQCNGSTALSSCNALISGIVVAAVLGIGIGTLYEVVSDASSRRRPRRTVQYCIVF